MLQGRLRPPGRQRRRRDLLEQAPEREESPAERGRRRGGRRRRRSSVGVDIRRRRRRRGRRKRRRGRRKRRRARRRHHRCRPSPLALAPRVGLVHPEGGERGCAFFERFPKGKRLVEAKKKNCKPMNALLCLRERVKEKESGGDKRNLHFHNQRKNKPKTAMDNDPVSPPAAKKKGLGARGWIWIVFGVLQVRRVCPLKGL